MTKTKRKRTFTPADVTAACGAACSAATRVATYDATYAATYRLTHWAILSASGDHAFGEMVHVAVMCLTDRGMG
mgnify:CR=1 FL=1